jgi:hypothetical protein
MKMTEDENSNRDHTTKPKFAELAFPVERENSEMERDSLKIVQRGLSHTTCLRVSESDRDFCCFLDVELLFFLSGKIRWKMQILISGENC